MQKRYRFGRILEVICELIEFYFISEAQILLYHTKEDQQIADVKS